MSDKAIDKIFAVFAIEKVKGIIISMGMLMFSDLNNYGVLF